MYPVVRRTWAPQGQTPLQYSWEQRGRWSVISALTVSPKRQRLGLYFQLHEHNICSEDLVSFLTELQRCLKRKLIVVLDRWSAHRKAVRLLEEAKVNWLEVEWLPPYAPDLNPVEMVWNHSKYTDLANFIPDDLHQLKQAVTHSLQQMQNQSDLLRSFFRFAQLRL